MNDGSSNRRMRGIEECVYEAVFDILRELEREEGLRLFAQLVGRLTADELEHGMAALVRSHYGEHHQA
jgi:hypothetical protein